MKITKVSIISGKQRTIDMPITEKQFTAWQNGMLVQDAMPHLTADQREFLLSGITADEWEQEFGGEDDDEEEIDGLDDEIPF